MTTGLALMLTKVTCPMGNCVVPARVPRISYVLKDHVERMFPASVAAARAVQNEKQQDDLAARAFLHADLFEDAEDAAQQVHAAAAAWR